MARFTLQQFEDFLRGVDLDAYRERYSKIKTVEMDLPRDIQTLDTIYGQYWENKDNRETPPTFDEYYKIYWATNEARILAFREKTGFGSDCDCFERGLEARTYRTWASLITQIHGGFVAETVFGVGSVRMGTELDHRNIDIQIVNPDGSERLRIQIKKETHRSEIARMQKNVRNQNGAVDVYYIVPTAHDYANPYYRNKVRGHQVGDEKPFVKDFKEWYPETATMERLPNGFIIFTRNAFLGLED